MNKCSSVAVIGLAILFGVGFASGDTGDPVAARIVAASDADAQLPVGYAAAADVIGRTVERAVQPAGEDGQCLLPPGTVVDDVQWVDNVLKIHLTVPAENRDWCLSDTDIETIGRAFGYPFLADPAFGGTRTRVRCGPDQPYGSLERFLIGRVAPAPAGPAALDEIAEPLQLPADAPAAPGTRGPTQQASRQPTGALSGVTVYASAGHGWTAGSSTWYLQRPVLLEMTEDHGNIDMLNYFVHYAFNAGATVVPFRPTGWQTIEIVLDNDDPGVTFTGTWSSGGGSKYYENGVTSSGINYRWATASTSETHTARYAPTITVTDFYPVYCFTIAGTNRTLQTYRVGHSGGVAEIVIDHREVGNGWIWLGDYYLEAGGDNYVEITNLSAESGVVVADAIRWGSGWGDIVRPGPGSVSGYPRDEECQRYWAESELGNNAAGFDSDIWDGGGDDGGDNVRCGGKWAREMNQVPGGGVFVDRWKRVHLEFHSNAFNGNARGQICLITDLGATTYQQEYATILSDEVDADMSLLESEFEHDWYDRASPTYTSSYGAICTGANSDEFDATIVELAFHDNQLDAELLRDDRVRAAMARSCVQGIIRFLNSLPDSQVPLAFPPDTPQTVRAVDDSSGNVVISWQPPLADGAHGDSASGYIVYQSSNGYGFGDPIVLGDVLSTTITDMALGETRYFRVAATNSGGESMPSEVLAVRRRLQSDPDVLIVNGFDRLRRQINPLQTFTQPPNYAGDTIERQIWRRSNAFDYAVQHAQALAASGYGFDSCCNEAVLNSSINLDDYDVVVWILGTESSEDATFTITEQNKVSDFLFSGKGLFVTGSELAYDLIGQGNGVSFCQDTLRAGYVADDAGTFDVTGAAGGILASVGAFDFDPALGACYEVRSPDELSPGADAQACVNYVGGGVAGVQFDSLAYRVVTFGFPFETISSSAKRSEIMGHVMAFLLEAEPLPFDYDRDLDVDFDDFFMFAFCYQLGPDITYPDTHACVDVAGEFDDDIDLEDFHLFQQSYGLGMP